MSAQPQPSAFEDRTNATYEALMWAFSRPGLVRDMPEPGQCLILEALIDRECQVYCDSAEMQAQAKQSGAELVGPEAADHLFLATPPAAQLVRGVRLGSDLYPEEGATLVLTATLGTGVTLRLTGPGVDGQIDVQVDGLPADFWAVRAQVQRYPMGFDLVLVDGARILGVPRSTHVEVL